MMNSKLSLIVVVVLSCAAISSAQRRATYPRGALIDSDNPAVFISFIRLANLEPLGTGYGRAHLLLRIKNNSRWPIILDINGVPKEYGDAGLFYVIADSDHDKIRIDNRCHVCSDNPLGPGRSIVFAVPRDWITPKSHLRMDYYFSWEQHRNNGAGSVSYHYVEFYFDSLAKSVWSAEALSNKSLDPSGGCAFGINIGSEQFE
jgi:hypothetical protein